MSRLFSSLILLLLLVAPVVAQQCPSVTIEGPTKVADDVSPIKLKAKLEGTDELKYRWNLSVGTIISGANSNEIQFDRKYLGGQVITVSLETARADDSCRATVKHLIEVEPPRPPECPYDSFGDISFEEEKARLDNFAIQVQNSPESRACIVAYAGNPTYTNEAQFRLTRAKNYMSKVRGISPDRIVIIEAGHQTDLQLVLWVVPSGAKLPQFDRRSVPENELKFTKRRPKSSR